MNNLYLRCAALLAVALVIVCLPSTAHAKRDHLTPEEADLVRDEQILDKRIGIFIKAAERRIAVMNGVTVAATPSKGKDKEKDSEKWGPMPKGTRAELLSDVANILNEAITNIDDVGARDEKNPLVPKALRRLAEASSRFINQLSPLQSQLKDAVELQELTRVLDNAQSVVEAAGRLPAAPPSDKKSSKKS